MGDAAAADARLRRAAPRIALACLVMGARSSSPPRAARRRPRRPAARATPALALLVALGMASYAVAAFATGALRPADIRAALRRG